MSYPTQSPRTSESTAEATTLEHEKADDEQSPTDRRDVIVPLRVYKAVTVFSTLFAIVTIVGGFMILDIATNRGSADLSAVDPLFAMLGLGIIAFGAVVYAFSTRFRTHGMGPGEGGETDG